MKSQKGSIIIPLILVIIIAFGVLLTSDTLYNKTATNPLQLFTNPEVDKPNNDKQNLQLEKLKFKPYVPPTFDCGDNGVKRSEPSILWAIKPDPGTPVTSEGSVKAFYQDEWPLTLGKGATPSNGNQDHAVNPNVGDETARDINGFPYFPALFVSDITTDPNNKSGDAQNNGTPHKPSEVFGAWQDYGKGGTSLSPNDLNLGSLADPYPTESNVSFDGKKQTHYPSNDYGAEIVWKASDLGLTSGHTYRAQFILHDGDGGGGDISEGCTTIQY